MGFNRELQQRKRLKISKQEFISTNIPPAPIEIEPGNKKKKTINSGKEHYNEKFINDSKT